MAIHHATNEGGQRDPTTIEDAEIKAIARQDRSRAFDLLVRKYWDRLFRHALYLLRDGQEAYDMTQETLIRALQEPNFFDEGFKMRGWLFKVLSNLSYNLTRDKNRRGAILRQAEGPVAVSPPEPLSELAHHETRDYVEKALDNVPEKDQRILRLKYYDDLSYFEIAEILKCKMGTVMSRLARAKDKLLSAVQSMEHAEAI